MSESCSKVFVAKCCHLHGCQAWDIRSKALDEFNVTWRKAVRRLRQLPYTARSRLLPELVGTATLRDQVTDRFAGLYNDIMKGGNNKMHLLACVSREGWNHRKGVIGINVDCISRTWRCKHTFLSCNVQREGDSDIIARAQAIRELTCVKERTTSLPSFAYNEVHDMMCAIACY